MCSAEHTCKIVHIFAIQYTCTTRPHYTLTSSPHHINTIPLALTTVQVQAVVTLQPPEEVATPAVVGTAHDHRGRHSIAQHMLDIPQNAQHLLRGLHRHNATMLHRAEPDLPAPPTQRRHIASTAAGRSDDLPPRAPPRRLPWLPS